MDAISIMKNIGGDLLDSKKTKLAESEIPRTKGRVIDYSFPRMYLDLFEKLSVRTFSNGTTSLFFKCENLDNQSKVKSDYILQELFKAYGKDSSNYSFKSTSAIGPFGEETYTWYIDFEKKVVSNSENIHHGVIFYVDENELNINILNAQNIIECDSLIQK